MHRKTKIFVVLLILTSFLGYLEWGKSQQLFLLEAEIQIIIKLFSSPSSILHPFILFPFGGQMLLCVTLLQHQPSKLLIYIGMWMLASLLLFMLVIGVISFRLPILLSTIPFVCIVVFTSMHLRQRKLSM